jgi:hypothetical protein
MQIEVDRPLHGRWGEKVNGTSKINVREWKEQSVFLVWQAQAVATASGTTGFSNLIQSPAELPIHLDF